MSTWRRQLVMLGSVVALVAGAGGAGCNVDVELPGPLAPDAVDPVDADTSDTADSRIRDTGVDTETDTGAPDTSDGMDTADSSGPDTDAGRRGPPYPIVLAHGLAGFDHLADVDELEYFYEIPEMLRKEEGEVVMVSEVDPFDDSYKRGHQLQQQIEKFTRKNNWDKVHIVGHSQGGLDARYVAHERPDLVASVVTISTPHKGTRISDIALKIVDYPNARKVVNGVVELIGEALYDKNGNETRAVEAIRQFSEPAIKKFNNRITDRPSVYYASIAGRSGSLPEQDDCDTPNSPQFLDKWDYTVDPVDPTLRATEAALHGPAGTVPNDGLVRVEKAKWGEFLGCVPADHMDEIGQVAGDHPGGVNTWSYRDFYRKLADFLHTKE